jgi:hypothetical protein
MQSVAFFQSHAVISSVAPRSDQGQSNPIPAIGAGISTSAATIDEELDDLDVFQFLVVPGDYCEEKDRTCKSAASIPPAAILPMDYDDREEMDQTCKSDASISLAAGLHIDHDDDGSARHSNLIPGLEVPLDAEFRFENPQHLIDHVSDLDWNDNLPNVSGESNTLTG